jgi:hypothetical protein
MQMMRIRLLVNMRRTHSCERHRPEGRHHGFN